MTKIAFIHSEGVLVGFDAHGHTGYADAGEDIVCAAVSALTQATVIGMQEVLSLPVRIERDDRAGRLMAVVAPGMRKARVCCWKRCACRFRLYAHSTPALFG